MCRPIAPMLLFRLLSSECINPWRLSSIFGQSSENAIGAMRAGAREQTGCPDVESRR